MVDTIRIASSTDAITLNDPDSTNVGVSTEPDIRIVLSETTSSSVSGATAFISLSDTPAGFASQAGKFLKVDSSESALEFTDAPAGATNLSVAQRGSETLDVASSTGSDATIPAATESETGLLTAADKTKINKYLNPASSDDGKHLAVNSSGNVVAVNAPSGGENNVQADWSETDTNDDAYIDNKPAIVTQADAEAGTATDQKIWTAERVKEAIESLAPPRGTTPVGGRFQGLSGTRASVTLAVDATAPVTITSVSGIEYATRGTGSHTDKIEITSPGTYRLYGELTVQGDDRSAPGFSITGTGITVLGYSNDYVRDAETAFDVVSWVDFDVSAANTVATLVVINRNLIDTTSGGIEQQSCVISAVDNLYLIGVGGIKGVPGTAGDFSALSDTPASYSSSDAGKVVKVKSDGSGLEFATETDTDTDTTYTAGTGLTLSTTEFSLTDESYTTAEKGKLGANADKWSAKIWNIGDFSWHSKKLYECIVARVAGDTSSPDSDTTGWRVVNGNTGSGGASAFTGLSDTPSAFGSNAGKVVKVNSNSNGLEFADDVDTTYSNATTSVSGLMSGGDKTHLNAVAVRWTAKVWAVGDFVWFSRRLYECVIATTAADSNPPNSTKWQRVEHQSLSDLYFEWNANFDAPSDTLGVRGSATFVDLGATTQTAYSMVTVDSDIAAVLSRAKYAGFAFEFGIETYTTSLEYEQDGPASDTPLVISYYDSTNTQVGGTETVVYPANQRFAVFYIPARVFTASVATAYSIGITVDANDVPSGKNLTFYPTQHGRVALMTQENVQPDWTETGTTEDAYIQNKPAIVTQADAEAGTATVEKMWTAERVKQAIAALATDTDTTYSDATSGTSGLMPGSDKTKLDKYPNPSSADDTKHLTVNSSGNVVLTDAPVGGTTQVGGRYQAITGTRASISLATDGTGDITVTAVAGNTYATRGTGGDTDKIVIASPGTYRLYGDLTAQGSDRTAPGLTVDGTGVTVLGFPNDYVRDADTAIVVRRWVDFDVSAADTLVTLQTINRDLADSTGGSFSIQNVTISAVADLRILPISGVKGDDGDAAGVFTDLTDTPTAYTGQGGKVVKVKSDVSGLEFADDSDTTYVAATTSADGLMTSGDKTKLNKYPSPESSDDTKHLAVDSSGDVELVDAPTDTTYTAGTGITLSGTEFSLSDKRYTSAEKTKLGANADNWTAKIWNVGDYSWHSKKLYECIVARVAGDSSSPDSDTTGWRAVNGGASSSGSSTFVGLSDTPSEFGTNAGKVLKVNTGNNALEFADDANTEYTAGTGLTLTNTEFTLSDEQYTTAEKTKLAASAGIWSVKAWAEGDYAWYDGELYRTKYLKTTSNTQTPAQDTSWVNVGNPRIQDLSNTPNTIQRGQILVGNSNSSGMDAIDIIDVETPHINSLVARNASLTSWSPTGEALGSGRIYLTDSLTSVDISYTMDSTEVANLNLFEKVGFVLDISIYTWNIADPFEPVPIQSGPESDLDLTVEYYVLSDGSDVKLGNTLTIEFPSGQGDYRAYLSADDFANKAHTLFDIRCSHSNTVGTDKGMQLNVRVSRIPDYSGSSSGGATNFLGLSDTPQAYTDGLNIPVITDSGTLTPNQFEFVSGATFNERYGQTFIDTVTRSNLRIGGYRRTTSGGYSLSLGVVLIDSTRGDLFVNLLLSQAQMDTLSAFNAHGFYIVLRVGAYRHSDRVVLAIATAVELNIEYYDSSGTKHGNTATVNLIADQRNHYIYIPSSVMEAPLEGSFELKLSTDSDLGAENGGTGTPYSFAVHLDSVTTFARVPDFASAPTTSGTSVTRTNLFRGSVTSSNSAVNNFKATSVNNNRWYQIYADYTLGAGYVFVNGREINRGKAITLRRANGRTDHVISYSGSSFRIIRINGSGNQAVFVSIVELDFGISGASGTADTITELKDIHFGYMLASEDQDDIVLSDDVTETKTIGSQFEIDGIGADMEVRFFWLVEVADENQPELFKIGEWDYSHIVSNVGQVTFAGTDFIAYMTATENPFDDSYNSKFIEVS